MTTVMENQAYRKRLKDLTCSYEESFNFGKLNIQGFGRSEKELIKLKDNTEANNYKLIMISLCARLWGQLI